MTLPPPKYQVLSIFKNSLGTIVGTYFNCTPPVADHKGHLSDLTQNCLAISDFDMIFQYVFSRWGGSTAYSTMFQEARITDLLVPRDKYYLANAGFAT